MIELNQVSYCYPNNRDERVKWALQAIDITVMRGECLLITGRSGCGKSTLLKILNGIIPHMIEGDLQGVVSVAKLTPSEQSVQQMAAHVGSVFQNPKSQFFHLNTTDEITFGCTNLLMPREDILQRLREVVAMIDIEHLIDRDIFALSGGEKQRIACAGVMAHQPDIFLLDEPSSNLDRAGIDALAKIIAQLKAMGKTVVIAEHRLYYLMDIADRIMQIEAGQIVAEYTPAELRSLGLAGLQARGLRTVHRPQLTPCQPVHSNCPVALTLENYLVKYSAKTVITIRHHQFYKHHVTAIIGQNGAGKSTLSRALCGLIGAQGDIRDSKKLSQKRSRQDFFMVMQDVNHQLFAESVYEELFLGTSHDSARDVEALSLLDELDLLQFKDSHPLALSGGQKQRVAIASAIFSGCQYLIFDEPTSGLDHHHMMAFSSLIASIKARVQLILIISHDYELINHCCDSICQLIDGELINYICE